MTLKMNDRVQTPNGPGRIISMPIGSSTYYTVLHDNHQAAIYRASDLKLIEEAASNG